jgi:V8-like Glu-specific endopeptidase
MLGTLLLAGVSDTVAAAGIAAHHSTAFKGTSAVGALFTSSDGHLGRHFCTASVVHSPQQDLLITAAHCMAGRHLLPVGSVQFAPGYHAGKFPHGLWEVTEKFVDNRWATTRDPNDDVAFLVAGRPGTHVERHTGAETLVINQHLPQEVQVIGYPDATSKPITCTARAHSFDPGTLRQVQFDCDGYTPGTSGGPFLSHVSAKTHEGSVIGVIGGFEEGGNSPNVSYSSKFRTNIEALYTTAMTAKPGQTSG